MKWRGLDRAILYRIVLLTLDFSGSKTVLSLIYKDWVNWPFFLRFCSSSFPLWKWLELFDRCRWLSVEAIEQHARSTRWCKGLKSGSSRRDMAETPLVVFLSSQTMLIHRKYLTLAKEIWSKWTESIIDCDFFSALLKEMKKFLSRLCIELFQIPLHHSSMHLFVVLKFLIKPILSLICWKQLQQFSLGNWIGNGPVPPGQRQPEESRNNPVMLTIHSHLSEKIKLPSKSLNFNGPRTWKATIEDQSMEWSSIFQGMPRILGNEHEIASSISFDISREEADSPATLCNLLLPFILDSTPSNCWNENSMSALSVQRWDVRDFWLGR
jgi:hypothetical protein